MLRRLQLDYRVHIETASCPTLHGHRPSPTFLHKDVCRVQLVSLGGIPNGDKGIKATSALEHHSVLRQPFAMVAKNKGSAARWDA